jgi:hypothetical protein
MHLHVLGHEKRWESYLQGIVLTVRPCVLCGRKFPKLQSIKDPLTLANN